MNRLELRERIREWGKERGYNVNSRLRQATLDGKLMDYGWGGRGGKAKMYHVAPRKEVKNGSYIREA